MGKNTQIHSCAREPNMAHTFKEYKHPPPSKVTKNMGHSRLLTQMGGGRPRENFSKKMYVMEACITGVYTQWPLSPLPSNTGADDDSAFCNCILSVGKFHFLGSISSLFLLPVPVLHVVPDLAVHLDDPFSC